MQRPRGLGRRGGEPVASGWDGKLTVLSLAYFFFGWEWVESEVSVFVGMAIALTLVAVISGSLAADHLKDRRESAA